MKTDSNVCGFGEDSLGRNRRRGVALLDERKRQREEESFNRMCRRISLIFQAMSISLLFVLSLSVIFPGEGGAITAKTFAQMASFVVIPFLACSIFIQCSSRREKHNSK